MAKCRYRVFLIIAIIVMTITTTNMVSYAENNSSSILPKTGYAKEFIKLCDGQKWFMDEIERLLNLEQKTISEIKDKQDFKNIKHIGLSGKMINGSIPRAVGELFNLESLFLSENNFSGKIPNEIFNLNRLVERKIWYKYRS